MLPCLRVYILSSESDGQTPTKIVGVSFRAPAPEKAALSEKFDLRTGKSYRKRPFLTPLKAAVYAASLPRPCSAPPPSSRNGIGYQEVTRLSVEGAQKEVNLFKKSNVETSIWFLKGIFHGWGGCAAVVSCPVRAVAEPPLPKSSVPSCQ